MAASNFNYNDMDLKYVEVAVLMQITNKYHPGICPFYLQSLTPSQPKTLQTQNIPFTGNNLANDSTNIGASGLEAGSTIQLELPREIAREFPLKWIPQGTRFLVLFIVITFKVVYVNNVNLVNLTRRKRYYFLVPLIFI